MFDVEFGFEFDKGLVFLSRTETLRGQINTLNTIRENMLGMLDDSNDAMAAVGISLRFPTLIAHPTYEIHLIDDLITKLSAELAVESRKEKLAQSV